MFVDLMDDIRSTFTDRFFKFQVQVNAGPPPTRSTEPQAMRAVKPEAPVAESDLMVGAPAVASRSPAELQATHGEPGDTPAQPQRRSVPKVGRNDPCPCGSGKKYKKCHGAAG
jgi:preprotein translocase subunit SecA